MAETCTSNENCKIYNRTTETSSNQVESTIECVDKNYVHMVNKKFVFDFVPCEPKGACLGNNECGKGYEGSYHQCNEWFFLNKGDVINLDETKIRSCQTDR